MVQMERFWADYLNKENLQDITIFFEKKSPENVSDIILNG